MKILMDVDEVCADLVGAILAITGKTNRSHASEWDWFDKYPEAERKATRRALGTAQFWLDIPVKEEAIRGISYLRSQKHQIIWCTAPYEPCVGWVNFRQQWLNKHFHIDSHREARIFTADKEHIRADVFIDDRINNVVSWQKNNREGLGFIMKCELNQASPCPEGLVFADWQDIMDNSLFRRK